MANDTKSSDHAVLNYRKDPQKNYGFCTCHIRHYLQALVLQHSVLVTKKYGIQGKKRADSI